LGLSGPRSFAYAGGIVSRAFGLGLLLVAGACAAGSPPPAAPGPVFAHLDVRGRVIRSRGPLPLSVAAPPHFRRAGPEHRVAEFDGHPFEVSLAAWLGDSGAVMVHAERVRDGSGASNYDSLPAAGWPAPGFRLRSYCVTVTAEQVAEEHDLRFLDRAGWSPLGPVALEQYLRTTPDHNREVVVSLVVRRVDCADAARAGAALDALRATVHVESGGT
jgi:hypothetical protein